MYLYILAISFIAGAVQGATGFGFGVFAMGLLTLMFSVKDSVLLVVSLSVVTSLTVVSKLWHHVNWRVLIPVWPTVMVGRIVAFPLLQKYGQSYELKYALALFLGAFALHLLYRSFRPTDTRKALPLPVAWMLGLFGGFTGGLFGMGGPWLVYYFLSVLDDTRTYKATLQVMFISTGIFTLTLHGLAGDLSVSLVPMVLIGIVATALGTRLGIFLTRSSQLTLIRRLACIVMLFASINNLLDLS